MKKENSDKNQALASIKKEEITTKVKEFISHCCYNDVEEDMIVPEALLYDLLPDMKCEK